MLDTYLTYIQESTNLKVMYHGSHIQNMKVLDPKTNISKHEKTKAKWIYAMNERSLCSAFTFPWTDDMGIQFGGINGVYTLKVPKHHMTLLDKPCSIYEVDSANFIKAKTGMKHEYVSSKKVKVLKETKYKTAKQCILSTDIRIKVI